MPFAEVHGYSLHYALRGEGPRLLFIHGIGADLSSPVGPHNSPLAARFTILAFDPRGLGRSEREVLPATMAEMADDAAGLAAAVGWDRYHVLGASMGGMVAQELALRHPGAVDRLVLAVTNAGGANAGPAVENLYALPISEALLLADTRQDAAWVAAHPQEVAGFAAAMRAGAAAHAADPALARGYANQAAAVAAHDAFERLSQITAPALVFGGRYDGSNPLERVAAMAARIPGARHETVESGHGGWVADPTVWQMVGDFLLGEG